MRGAAGRHIPSRAGHARPVWLRVIAPSTWRSARRRAPSDRRGSPPDERSRRPRGRSGAWWSSADLPRRPSPVDTRYGSNSSSRRGRRWPPADPPGPGREPPDPRPPVRHSRTPASARRSGGRCRCWCTDHPSWKRKESGDIWGNTSSDERSNGKLPGAPRRVNRIRSPMWRTGDAPPKGG